MIRLTVLYNLQPHVDEAEWAAVMEVTNKAIQQFDAFRLAEGQAMENDLQLRVSNIKSALPLVDPHQEERVVRVRQRMSMSLKRSCMEVVVFMECATSYWLQAAG